MIQRFRRGEVARDDLPRIVHQIANELADLVRLSGAILASVLSQPRISIANPEGRLYDRMSQSVGSDRLVFRVTEAAQLLGISRSGLYEMIYKREIGVVRFGNRSIRIPKSEIERLIADSLIPPLAK
jgi:excisionase family DNA binding protein